MGVDLIARDLFSGDAEDAQMGWWGRWGCRRLKSAATIPGPVTMTPSGL